MTAAFVVLAGCSAASPDSSSGDSTVLVGGITRPAAGLDPLAEFTAGSIYLSDPVLSSLITVDANGDLQPDQATDWSSNDDATVWTIHLRGDKYLDGTVFDANLVADAFNTALDPAAPAAGVTGLVGLLSQGGTKAIDDSTVEFTLDAPYSGFAYALTVVMLNWLPAGTDTSGYASGKVGGTGQYLVESYDPDSGVVFTKNPDYWNADNIYVDELDLKFYDDDQAITLALQAGEIDFAPGLSSTSAATLKKADDITVLTAPSASYNAIRFNTTLAPFDDVRVRQAFALAIDRQALVDTLFDGDAEVANDNVFASVFGDSDAVSDGVPQKKRDLDEARKLLADAGHASGLDVTLTIPDTDAISALAQLLQSQLAEAGVTVTIDALPEADYYGSFDDPNTPWLTAGFAITPWVGRADPSAALRAAYTSDALFNESHFSNAELDSLVSAYDAAADDTERAEIAVQLATIQSDQVPAIIAYFAPGYRAVSSSVENLPAGPAPFLDLAGVRVTR